ncbi:MAG: adenylate/guanylate cyclase domain-containing protein [bacterium]|nr:adenylate/guanylate cyclase domain-containing protein [bacterium]
MEHKDLTIMFTDIKGFTQRTSQQSRDDTIGLIRQHKELLTPVLESKGGKIIKEIGDAFLVVFESPTNAVLAGQELPAFLPAGN